MNTHSLLELQEVSAMAGGRVRLYPMSLAVAAGEIVTLIGPNGSGKSTMLALMASELKPSSGRVLLGGQDAAHLSVTARARLRSVLVQETAVAFPFTAREVISWGRTPWQRTPSASDDDSILRAVVHEHELEGLVDRPVNALSGGERKRVHIARVIAQQAPLILLDEADAELDLLGRKLLDGIILSHVRSGGAAVIVTHDARRLAPITDRVVLMSGGRMQHAGTPGDVLTSANLSSAFGASLTW